MTRLRAGRQRDTRSAQRTARQLPAVSHLKVYSSRRGPGAGPGVLGAQANLKLLVLALLAGRCPVLRRRTLRIWMRILLVPGGLRHGCSGTAWRRGRGRKHNLLPLPARPVTPARAAPQRAARVRATTHLECGAARCGAPARSLAAGRVWRVGGGERRQGRQRPARGVGRARARAACVAVLKHADGPQVGILRRALARAARLGAAAGPRRRQARGRQALHRALGRRRWTASRRAHALSLFQRRSIKCQNGVHVHHASATNCGRDERTRDFSEECPAPRRTQRNRGRGYVASATSGRLLLEHLVPGTARVCCCVRRGTRLGSPWQRRDAAGAGRPGAAAV